MRIAVGEEVLVIRPSTAFALDVAATRIDPLTERFETVGIKPRKGDVEVKRVVLAWIPEAR